MANQKLVAADTLDRFITMYAGLNDALVLLKSLGSVEQQVEGLGIQRDEIIAETKKAKADLDKAKAKLVAQEEQVAEWAKTNADARNAEVVAANGEAAAIIERAKEKAANILGEAEGKGAAVEAAAVERLKSLQAAAVDAQALADFAAAKQAEAQLELNIINKKIDQAKAKVASLLG